jgi:hypothetical protein
MPLPPNVQELPSQLLIEQLEAKAGEKALLSFSDAPAAELRNVQRALDDLTQELMRRCSW